jgi:hypothetical protein
MPKPGVHAACARLAAFCRHQGECAEACALLAGGDGCLTAALNATDLVEPMAFDTACHTVRKM